MARRSSLRPETLVPVSTYVPKSKYRELRARAERQRRSLSMQVFVYIERGLEQDSEEGA